MRPQVAKEIISFCTSCKRDVMHTIVVMKEDRILRVLCRSCKKEHAFRHSPENSSAARKPPARKSVPRKSVPDPEDWRMEMSKVKNEAAKPYAMDGLFEEGQKLAHRTFGTGIVRTLVSHDKMEVLFEDGIKLLVRGIARPR
jgi:hypothetical protein